MANNPYYKKYCGDKITCAFCGSQSNMYYIKQHLKTSKKCKTIQADLEKVGGNDFLLKQIDFNKKINIIKSELRVTE